MDIPKEIKQLIEMYAITFQSDNGKKILEDLENRFHIHSSTMDDSNNNLAFLEGQRSVILFIKKMLKGDKHGRRKPGSGTTTNSV